MKIDIILNPESQYKALRYFETGLQEALARQRVETCEYSFDQNLLLYLYESSADYTLGINIALPDALIHIPHIAYMVDWVTYTPAFFSNKHTIVCNIDQQSTQFVEKFGHCQAIFLPHAVAANSIIEAEIQRDIDILFSGSFIDEKPLMEWLKTHLSDHLFAVIENVIAESLFSAITSHIYQIINLLEIYPKYQRELNEKQIDFFNFCNIVEQIMRARDRISLLQTIDREIHIYSYDNNAWKQALGQKQNCVFHGAIDFSDIAALFQRAKIVLNSAPMFKEGLHERFLYALANGASAITNKNALVTHYFQENHALGVFLAPEYQAINHVIDTMLEDEHKRVEEVRQAQKTIQLHHTWDQRAATLLNIL